MHLFITHQNFLLYEKGQQSGRIENLNDISKQIDWQLELELFIEVKVLGSSMDSNLWDPWRKHASKGLSHFLLFRKESNIFMEIFYFHSGYKFWESIYFYSAKQKNWKSFSWSTRKQLHIPFQSTLFNVFQNIDPF